MRKARTITSWILAGLLCLGFLLAGVGKLTGAATSMFEAWGYPAWFAILIGLLEVAGAVGLVVPKTTRLAVYGLTIIMLGAMYTHLTNEEAPEVVRPGIFLAVLWAVWWLRGRAQTKT